MAERENVIRLKMSVSNGEIPMRIKSEGIPLKYYGSSNGEIITEVNEVGRKIESRLSEAIKNKINKVDDCVSGNLSAEYPQATEFSLGGAKLYIENNGEKQYVTAQQLKELLQDSPVARRIILGGDATGETSFDGSADVTIPVTIINNSHSHTIDNVEGLQGALNGKEPSGSSATALQNAKTYTDGKIANLINSAPTTLDTLGEIATAMQNNEGVVDALEQAIGSKASSDSVVTLRGEQTITGAKKFSGAGIHFLNEAALPNKGLQYVLGIDGFASGGQMGWQNASEFLKGNLTKNIVTQALGYTPVDTSDLGSLASKDSLSKGEVGLGNVSNDAQVKRTEMGVASGVATLGADGKVPASQLPSTTVTTDSELSSTSTNPVQNKVVHAALEQKANADSVVTSVSMRASGNTPLKFYYSVNGGEEKTVVLGKPSIATQSAAGLLSATDQTIGGTKTFASKILQGSVSNDSTISDMNQFENDLFVKGNGSAPNNPRVAGFYLGKSTTDENRHMDIVSGSDYSYIDFNKESVEEDYRARLLVNVTTGDVQWCWASNATRSFNFDGGTVGAAVFVEGGVALVNKYASKSEVPQFSYSNGRLVITRG